MTKRELKRKAKELLNEAEIKAFQKDIILLEEGCGGKYIMFEHKGVEYQYFNNHLELYK